MRYGCGCTLEGWLSEMGLVALAGKYQHPYFAMHIESTQAPWHRTQMVRYLIDAHNQPVQSTPELFRIFLNFNADYSSHMHLLEK